MSSGSYFKYHLTVGTGVFVVGSLFKLDFRLVRFTKTG
jgi:hypothetical protein